MRSLPEAVTPSFQYSSRPAGPPYPRPSGRMPPGATGWDPATGRWVYPGSDTDEDAPPLASLAPLAPEADEPPKEVEWVGLGLFLTAVGVSAGLVC